MTGHGTAALPVPVRQTGRPVASGDERSHPNPTHLGRLFYVNDCNSNTRFLVDTGAEVSVIPPTRAERSHPQCAFSLQGVDGSSIATYGVHSRTLNIGLRRTFCWVTSNRLSWVQTSCSILASWLT